METTYQRVGRTLYVGTARHAHYVTHNKRLESSSNNKLEGKEPSPSSVFETNKTPKVAKSIAKVENQRVAKVPNC